MSLWPWDRDAVLASARRTGALVVAHEAVAAGGFGAEVAATVAERAPGVAIRRLGAPRSLIPYAPNLEERMRVTEGMIAEAALGLVGERAA